MAGSSTPCFPWNPTSITVALDTIWNVVCDPRDRYPFQASNLDKAVSKLNARIPETPQSVPLKHVTRNDLIALLEDRRQLFERVCDLANLPTVLGFSSFTNKLSMFPHDYEAHIQAFPGDKELIDNPVPNFFHLFMFFGNGIMVGDVRRRRASTTYYAANKGRSSARARGRSRARARGRGRTNETTRTTATTVQPNGNNDNDDDDFMPEDPNPPLQHVPGFSDTDSDPEPKIKPRKKKEEESYWNNNIPQYCPREKHGRFPNKWDWDD